MRHRGAAELAFHEPAPRFFRCLDGDQSSGALQMGCAEMTEPEARMTDRTRMSKNGGRLAKNAKSNKTKKTPALDAVALLKADHRKVEDLFEQYEKATKSTRKETLAQQICLELCVHTAIEEEIFYPALRGEIEEDTLDEAYVEHDGAKMLIAEILDGSPDEEFYDAKVKVLSEEIKHHVKEEEQRDGMFAQAKKTDVDLDALGEQMAARKAQLMAEFKKTGVPTPETRSMKGVKMKVGKPVQ
jgi:hemerythrin superfamily protein